MMYTLQRLALWIRVGCVLTLVSACGGSRVQPAGTASIDHDGVSKPATYAVVCMPAFSFTARTEGEQVWLYLPDTTLVLPHVVAASGAKYSDGTITFWTKGEEARLETAGAVYEQCTMVEAANPWENAAHRGVDFRAVGQEPGWYLEIVDGERVTFVYDYGRDRVTTPAPEPDIDSEAGRAAYLIDTEAHSLHIVLEDRPCQDTMSGEAFNTAVSVVLDGATYHGCGRPFH